jgi:hypothetical protein
VIAETLAIAGHPASTDEPAMPPLSAHVARLAKSLPAPAAAALERIDGDGRKLLAARSYLRAGPSLPERWRRSDAQIEGYRTSDEARAARAAVERVRARFAAQNPGYDLSVDDAVRSLDTQIAAWNRNASVGAASDALLRDAVGELASEGSRFDPSRDAAASDTVATARFARWLTAWTPEVPPTLAAPGLSAHGRSRAFDFQVRHGDQIIAATDASQIETVWDGQGWTGRLAAAVAASEHFRGPLESPREPWH